MSTRRRASAYDALTCRIESLTERAAWSARSSTSALRALATVSGSTQDLVCAGGSRGARGSATRVAPSVPWAAAAAASAASRSPASLRSAVWANPVVLATHDADPRARSRPGHELLDLAVVEARRRRATILGEHLGEVAAVAQRGLERSLEYRFFDQVASCGGCLS